MTRSRLVGLAATVLVTAASAGCAGAGTGSGSTATPRAPDATAGSGSQPVITRWWSGPGGAAGSTAEPGAALPAEPDVATYCGSLAQTESRSEQAPLDAAVDPAAVPSVLLWARETAAVAPAEIAPAWQPLIGMLTAIADPGAGSAPAVEAAALSGATTRIREHAASACGLTITFL